MVDLLLVVNRYALIVVNPSALSGLPINVGQTLWSYESFEMLLVTAKAIAIVGQTPHGWADMQASQLALVVDDYLEE